MILLIDNYDSFVYNLYQLIGNLRPDLRVVRNDTCTVEEIEEMSPQAIVISPGPGRPEDAGICIDVIRQFAGRVPILGVCLGHQAICKAFGGTVSYAKCLMHGKTSPIRTEDGSLLFKGMERRTADDPIRVARYHSLAAVPGTLPPALRVTAATEDGEVMAVEHTEYPIYGVQFHPESILTPEGPRMMENFLSTVPI